MSPSARAPGGPRERAALPSFDQHLAELRRTFDATFAEPPKAAEAGGELVLAIRAAGQPYAVRLADIGGVCECRKIVPLPGSAPGLAGITAIRGRLYAVHVLSSLLGASATDEEQRWLLIAGGDEPIALAVESIEACVEVKPDELVTTEGQEFVREMVTRDGRGHGILMLDELVALALRRVEEG